MKLLLSNTVKYDYIRQEKEGNRNKSPIPAAPPAKRNDDAQWERSTSAQ